MSVLDRLTLPTAGLPHQLIDVEAKWDAPSWARLWEMGVGKTWPTIVEAALLFAANMIDCLVVVAPKAAALNFVVDQVKQHMPPDVNAKSFAYSIPDRDKSWHKAGLDELLTHWRQRAGLVVLTVSYEAIMKDECKEILKALARCRQLSDKSWVGDGRMLIVADESALLGNDGSQRTQRAYSLSSVAGYRRILEGTPVTNNPLNIYPQMKFLDPDYWKKYRIFSYEEFQAMFCVIKKSPNLTVKSKWIDRTTGKPRDIMVPKIVGYQNLKALNEMLLAGASRLTTEEAGIKLPPQHYQRIKFKLTAKQRKLYDTLKKECMVYLALPPTARLGLRARRGPGR
jgi:hypothetical protein